jgi:hypothetical protein
LLFGFSSDPMESPDRPARAFVAISLGNGKVLDVSERAGEVRELDAGSFYTHAATIPGFTADPFTDTDGDGFHDLDEYLSGGDPTRGMTMPRRDMSTIDSDGDGIPDSTDRRPNDPDAPSATPPPIEPQSQAPSEPEPVASTEALYDTIVTYDDDGAGLDSSFAPADDVAAPYDQSDVAYERDDAGGFEA